MALLMETAKEIVGREFDELLLHSARVYNILQSKISKEDQERCRTWSTYYLSKSYHTHPARFFSFPRTPPQVRTVEEHPFGEGTFRLYAFPSRYKVRNPSFASCFHGFEANKTAYFAHWSHNDKGRNAIVCCHGWSLGEPRQAQRMFSVPRLFSMGLDVALFVIPFHWKRADSLLQRVNPPFPFRNQVLALEGFGQAIHDLYSVILQLKETGASRIGILGASLGGYITALFVSLTAIADLAALVVPFLNFHSLRIPLAISAPGVQNDMSLKDNVHSLWKIHTPTSHACKLPPESCLIIAAKGDRLCPFGDVQALYHHWGQPTHVFLRGGHTLFFPRRARGQAWYGFLVKNGFV